ncbi:MAG: YIP1 family protein [Niabella sp.]
MKNNLRSYLLNPVKVIPDKIQIIAGIAILIFAFWSYYFLGIIQDGIYHVSIPDNRPYPLLLIQTTLIAYLIPSLALFGAGRIFNGRTRLIDSWNSFLFSSLPLLIANIPAALLISNNEIQETLKSPDRLHNSWFLIRSAILACVEIPALIYSIVLLVNGFKTTTNAKKTIHYILMAAAIILSEVVYRLMCYPYLLKHF